MWINSTRRYEDNAAMRWEQLKRSISKKCKGNGLITLPAYVSDRICVAGLNPGDGMPAFHVITSLYDYASSDESVLDVIVSVDVPVTISEGYRNKVLDNLLNYLERHMQVEVTV